MIRDRGNKKWVSLMLPEHIKMIKDMKVDLNRQSRPMIDEYQVQEFEERIKYAQEYKLLLEFSIFDQGFIKNSIGRVIKLDPLSKQIKIKTMKSEFEYINFTDVIEIKILD
ncbi:YolD-like family protein [Heyndrickxia oleronia]|jgi:hypothetical protein|uniref:YolD-like family protein n=1 Tax=Heyndrickxia oleronia TaxID=38875 RepID=UPI002430177C|nr:YolD-like family protein [Heyndrickxia oleronia]MCI1592573.1 YolD-like family protein [Heyndrickxia oleronia]MCI1612791.1 YolD-like family protein [Heyndrickxia oleronia]MCI1743951.1 YolD-like family protein [Heyndrickxia oleronia]MCI1760665.1 YolD-like family protein [Heyndrickxia oleronia]